MRIAAPRKECQVRSILVFLVVELSCVAMYEFYDDMNDVFREPFAADGAVVNGAAVNGGSSGTGVTARSSDVSSDVSSDLSSEVTNPSRPTPRSEPRATVASAPSSTGSWLGVVARDDVRDVLDEGEPPSLKQSSHPRKAMVSCIQWRKRLPGCLWR